MTPSRPSDGSKASYESHFEHAALFEFSTVINSSLDPQFIYSHILLTIMGKLLATKGMVLIAGGRGEGFAVTMVKGFGQELVGERVDVKRIPRSLVFVGELDAARHPCAVFFKKHGVEFVLPMMIANKPVGMLGFGPRFTTHPLQSREITYLRSLANISATAVEKSRTIEAMQLVNRKLDRKIQELNTLFDLGKEFGASLDPDKIVRLLVFSLLGQMGVNRYVICLRDRKKMKIVASRIDGTPPGDSVLDVLAQLKGPSLTNLIPVRRKADPRPELAALGIAVVVPIQLQGEMKGLLLLGEKLSHEEFSTADVEFLSSLGNLAVISLENARLFIDAIERQKLEDELNIAREIQRGLLPATLPTIQGAGIAAANISSKQVGGDYYDAISVSGGRYVIAIGDVTGKGTPAALLMANLQATIRALVPLDLTLAELTGRVNDLLCLNTGGSRFVTFFWGILDPATRTLTYVNAGHNYPYVLRTDGSIERLEVGGMILGVMAALAPYEQSSVTFRSGDLLVLFTDGVSEAMSEESEEYGEERLEAVLRAVTHAEPTEILDRIRADVARFVNTAPQSDDITLMAIKFD